MNKSVGSSSNSTKVNPTGDILCTENNNFVNTANNEFFNTVNKEFFNEIKSPSQLNDHEVIVLILQILILSYIAVQRTPIVLFQIQIIHLLKKF